MQRVPEHRIIRTQSTSVQRQTEQPSLVPSECATQVLPVLVQHETRVQLAPVQRQARVQPAPVQRQARVQLAPVQNDSRTRVQCNVSMTPAQTAPEH